MGEVTSRKGLDPISRIWPGHGREGVISRTPADRMIQSVPKRDGFDDLARVADELAVRVPSTLAPLARLAFDYWWAWSEQGPGLFRSIDPERFEMTHQNPVRLLREAPPPALARAARDGSFLPRVEELERALEDHRRRRP